MSNSFSRLAGACCALLLICAPFAAEAQTNDVVTQKDATVNTLIDALTPPADNAAAAAASGTAGSATAETAPSGRTRSFKISNAQSTVKPKPAKPASASLMITFETESARLTPESKQVLDNLAKALTSDKLATFKFNIEGHADPRGGSDKNMKLSEERAEAVRQHLIAQYHIDGSRLIAIGKGDTEQLNVNNPAAPENRRVRVVTVVDKK